MKHKIMIVCAMLLCLLPSVGMLFFPQAVQIGSERLSQKPAIWTAEGEFNLSLLDETEDYVADHFALRSELVTLSSAVQGLLGTSASEQVILGKNGWLYYADTLGDYQGAATLSAAQANELAQLVRDMQDYCTARGATFLFTIAPNKNSLYAQNMPARYLVSDGDNNRALVEAALREQNVRYLDLYELFSTQQKVLYLAQDSHWTNEGAALAHDAIMEALGREERSPSPDGTEHKTGDLYRMLYPSGTQQMEQPAYAHQFSLVRPIRSEEEILIETTCAGGQGRLLFCRDSFGNALYPFLADDFAEATVTRAMPYPLGDVSAGDTVIVEIVERHLPLLLKNPPDLGTNNAG